MDDFDTFLKSRHVPDAPSNLAHRIIEASKAESIAQARPRVSFAKMARDLMAWFVIPQPAMALGLVLVLAVGLGVFGGDLFLVEESAPYYQESDEVELAFYLDDIFGYEDSL